MPYGYVIAQISIKDPKAYAEYVNMVQPTLDAFYGEFLVRGGKATSYEGDPPGCLLYTSPSPRDMRRSRMPSSA